MNSRINFSSVNTLDIFGNEYAMRSHKKIMAKVIALLCVNMYSKGKGPNTSEIQRIVFKNFGRRPTYWKCWMGGVIAKEMVQGILEHGYSCLPAFLYMIDALNVGTIYSIMVNKDDYLSFISDSHKSIANGIARAYKYAHHSKDIFTKEFSDHFEEFKNYYPEAAFFLEHELSFEKWSRAYFPSNRFDVMTTNIAKSINSMFIDEREYPMGIHI
ncbi:hypothetical protein BC332_01875 [Capsicum chinense]|nr:hypothetical protein BC332_01875 [Capsicum chinense]